MYERLFWSLVIIIPCLLGTGGITPAWAWGGGRQVGAAQGLGHIGAWGSRGLPYHGQSRYGVPGAGRPYGLYIGATVPAFQDETPVHPQVIVLSNSPQPGPAAPQAQMDFGYVPGCRAIPNGYHCDPARHEGQPN